MLVVPSIRVIKDFMIQGGGRDEGRRDGICFDHGENSMMKPY